MSTLYEIELSNEALDYWDSRVVEGPDAPAGEVPASVLRYADMLSRVAGQNSDIRIGATRLVTLDDRGVTSSAWTCYLYEAKGRYAMAPGDDDGQTECTLIGGEVVA